MPKPDDAGRVTINVKSVSSYAWDRARAAATRQGETMGEWLSRAVTQLTDREASAARELPPARPRPDLGQINPMPVPLAAADLADLMRSMSALAAASGTLPLKASVRLAYGLADALVRDAHGLPRKLPRIGKAIGQSLLENGEAASRSAPAQLPAPVAAKRRSRF